MKTKEELLKEKKHDFDSLVSVMEALRGEGGCPWDMEQTHTSVRKCLIEETYEVIEAIDKDDSRLLREELGDLMFQVVFHAQIEKEEERFDISDVIHDITHKMIVRHPHVFADTVVADSDEVIVNWDNIKKEEKHFASPAEVLKRVPPYMPALLRAEKVQGKALSKFSYGYKTEDEAWDAVEASLKAGAQSRGEDIGKALFALCAAAEMRGLDLEAILSGCTDSFISSFEDK
ncbi:MAG: nucleoside triphosphate pyrophosphohydrolase [Ruminococcaceae bacterium]|nr:nucleoside triphosphate pyrophosphohydrolase [Oscillospiraceae bacterium]